MEPLKTLRTRWSPPRLEPQPSADIEDASARVLELASLFESFEAELDATEEIFRAERRAYLTELQARLGRIDRS